MPRLFTYLMTHDSGFAPNPFHGTLTLATCKPGIRKTKGRDDWVAGFASQALVNNSKAIGVKIKHYGLVYLMQVSKVMPLKEYFEAPEFQIKKPTPQINKLCNLEKDYGDNIYSRDNAGIFKWWPNGNHDESFTDHDTQGENVLIADNFYYFGRNCPIPDNGWGDSVRIPKNQTYYGYTNDEEALQNIRYFLDSKNYRPGVHGDPCLWPKHGKGFLSHRCVPCSP